MIPKTTTNLLHARHADLWNYGEAPSGPPSQAMWAQAFAEKPAMLPLWASDKRCWFVLAVLVGLIMWALGIWFVRWLVL